MHPLTKFLKRMSIKRNKRDPLFIFFNPKDPLPRIFQINILTWSCPTTVSLANISNPIVEIILKNIDSFCWGPPRIDCYPLTYSYTVYDSTGKP